MKNDEKKNLNNEIHEEMEIIKDFANPKHKQPVPQPKDFEEIEY
jgi:hypothetical protein